MPNVVLIVADDLGLGDLGAYGQKKIRTPNIDKLSKGGMRFTNFYAGTSVCAPSRAALLTGVHTGHTAIRGNKEIQPEGQFPLPGNTVTIAENFKRSGYLTGCFGKWGLGPVGSSGDPLRQGFDNFYGYNCQRQSHNYFPDHLWDQSKRVEFPTNTKTSFDIYAPDLIQARALNFIDKAADHPFFLYLSYTLPHAALQLKEDTIFSQYKIQFGEQAQKTDSIWNGQGYAPQAFPRAAYATMVTKLDQYVGEIIKHLQDKGLLDNSIVIFTSDNGPHREGGNDPDFFNSAMGLRGYKRDLYEGGIRVPLIVQWPSRIKAGSKSVRITAAWDLAATFAEITKQPLSAYTDGISILPALLSSKGQQHHEFLYWEFHENGGRQAVRIEQWKGIRQNVIADPNAVIELYDLKRDPGEKTNIAKKYPEIVKAMRLIIEQQHVENDDFPLFKKN